MNARLLVLALAALVAAGAPGCAPKPADEVNVTTTTPAPDPSAPAPESPAPAPPTFVDRVWKVSASPAVAVGSTYVFHADGTLALTAPGGTPASGTWRRDGDGLVLVEEGIEYPTDIVALDADRFVIRSHNPGGTVDITLVPADAPTP
jgi:hypothetical protein